MTMVDGKVVNALSECKYSLKCNICGLTSQGFNDRGKVEEALVNVKEGNFRYGLSTLHAWIRSLEWMLHLSYKLESKKWGVPLSNEERERELERKREIQDFFKGELNLLVDSTKQGFGSTNDGNTARKVFRAFDRTAVILEVDEEIIRGLFIICQVINSKRKINTFKFKDFCDRFFDRYVSLYPWYPIPPSLHKIIVHGDKIIESFAVPIGQLSEEASEARNKHFKEFRRDHSRKFSRVDTNIDIMNWLLLTSDPFINSIRTYRDDKYVDFLPEVCNILDIERVDLEEDE